MIKIDEKYENSINSMKSVSEKAKSICQINESVQIIESEKKHE